MKRTIGVLAAALAISATPALAQESGAAGPGTLEMTIIPGGATFFASSDSNNTSAFGNYTLGATVDYNFNRYVGVEGEFGGTLGITQDLQLSAGPISARTPDTLNYSGNVVVSAPVSRTVVPYVTGGAGALTMFGRDALGVTDTMTLPTGNVGAGIKWYAPNGRWGLRGDYRFIAVGSKDDASAFFGRDTRYGHRVYGGVVINAVR